MVGRYRARTPVQRIGGELIRKTVVWASASPLPTSLCCNGLHARKSGGMQLLTTGAAIVILHGDGDGASREPPDEG